MTPSSRDAAVIPRVLLVDDNPDAAFGLRTNLELEGFEVVGAEDGNLALEMAIRLRPSLVLMDLMLPALNGFSLIRQLRANGLSVPIMVVSGQQEEADRVAALRLGANDFVGKPFSLLELLERVKIQVGRRSIIEEPDSSIARVGDAVVDLSSRSATRAGVTLPLTPKEFQLFSALWKAVGTVVEKKRLLNEVWGFKCDVETRTLDFTISKLRQKIEDDPSRPKHLQTVRGVGFRLVA